MPYVFVLNGRERCRAFHLTKDITTFGQRDDADVVLRDPWISWTHARIVKEGTGFAIEDLGSTNGTYVNCAKVTRRSLAEDDVIFLGRTHLLFVASNRPPSAPPPALPRDPAQERLGGTDRLAPAPPAETGRIQFRGPLEDHGVIHELEAVGREPDTDGFLPPPVQVSDVPHDAPANATGAIEIDVADLLDSSGNVAGAPVAAPAPAPPPPAIPTPPPLDEPRDPRDIEIERLRAEVRRLREEVTRLKEQYLDL